MSAADPSPRSVSLHVRELYKSYVGQPVLKGITFDVEPGEIFVIMGPSGSGKTVLLKHIIGLERPDQGEIFIDDAPIQEPGVMDRYRLAMVFQSGALLNSLTVGENVGLFLSEHRLKPTDEIDRIVVEKLDLLGLRGVKERLPSDLSGGMRKRVAIARALVMEPQLILYDEPTSELDPLMGIRIGGEILKLKRQIEVTSVVITHDRDLAFGVADRIGMLYDGRLLAVGSPDQIRAHPDPLIQRFLTANFNSNSNDES